MLKLHPKDVDMTLEVACQIETDYNKLKTSKPDRKEVLFCKYITYYDMC